nr:hypothetical protein CFP56_01177 [Quercus suber]
MAATSKAVLQHTGLRLVDHVPFVLITVVTEYPSMIQVLPVPCDCGSGGDDRPITRRSYGLLVGGISPDDRRTRLRYGCLQFQLPIQWWVTGAQQAATTIMAIIEDSSGACDEMNTMAEGITASHPRGVDGELKFKLAQLGDFAGLADWITSRNERDHGMNGLVLPPVALLPPPCPSLSLSFTAPPPPPSLLLLLFHRIDAATSNPRSLPSSTWSFCLPFTRWNPPLLSILTRRLAASSSIHSPFAIH